MSFLRYLVIWMFALSLSFLTSNTYAQPVEFGISGGLNVSSHLNSFRYSVDDINLIFDPKPSTAYQAGLVVRKNISQSLRWQVEPSFIMLGAKYEESFMLRGFEMQTDSKTELSYIQVPLVFQYILNPQRQIVYGVQNATTTYHLTGGFFGGYLLDAQFSGTNSGAPLGIPFQSDFSNDVTSQYSNYDGGIIFGAGLEHGLNQKVGLEARVQLSVLDSGDAPELTFKPHNTAVTLAVYFLL